MTGAESLIHTLINGGVEVCFANPGTSEIYFVAAVDQVPAMRPVLGLFEGVCTGAADGYGRMAGKPAATLLHLGPGLANGLANLHNARRAHTPLVNIIGDHATYHRQFDAPLMTDITALAQTVSGWVHSSEKAGNVAADAAAAIAAARQPPGQVATLILPGDSAWEEGEPPAPPPPPPQATIDQGRIEQVAAVLRRGEPSMMLLAGRALCEQAQPLLSRIAAATGARLMAARENGRLPRGAGRTIIPRFPYPVDQGVKVMADVAHLILVGAKPPVAFFAYPGKPGWLTPDSCQIHTLSTPEEDGLLALEALAEQLNLPADAGPSYALDRPALPTGEISPSKAWTALTALMPEGAIICDESITATFGSEQLTAGAPPHDLLTITGGAIGLGLPMAIGAAVACPERKVFAMQADGSAMYTLQALWTQAREQLDIVTVLFANQKYAILQAELANVTTAGEGSKALELLDLSNPSLDWVRLAEGMGVRAGKVMTAEAFNQQLADAINTPGPCLIEVSY